MDTRMVYIMAPYEGGLYVKINRPKMSVRKVVKEILKPNKVIGLFENGMVYDPYMEGRPTQWRHKYGDGGKKETKRIFREVMENPDIPEEYIK